MRPSYETSTSFWQLGWLSMPVFALFTFMNCGPSFAQQSLPKLDLQHAQLQLSLFDSEDKHIVTQVKDLPFDMQLTTDIVCHFHHGYHNIQMFCMNEKSARIMQEDRVSCTERDAHFIEVKQEVDGVTVSVKVVYQCVNEPIEV